MIAGRWKRQCRPTLCAEIGPPCANLYTVERGTRRKGAKGGKGAKGARGSKGYKGVKGVKGTRGAKGYLAEISRTLICFADKLHTLRLELALEFAHICEISPAKGTLKPNFS